MLDEKGRAREQMIARRVEVGRAAMSLGEYARAELIFREAARRFESPELAELADEAHAASVAPSPPQRAPLPATEPSQVKDASDRIPPRLITTKCRAPLPGVAPLSQSSPVSVTDCHCPIPPRSPAARPEVACPATLHAPRRRGWLAARRSGRGRPSTACSARRLDDGFTPTMAENRASQLEGSTAPGPAPETATTRENRPPPTVLKPQADVKPWCRRLSATEPAFASFRGDRSSAVCPPRPPGGARAAGARPAQFVAASNERQRPRLRTANARQ